MPTNIKVVRNAATRAITAFDVENPGSSFMLNAGTQSPPTGTNCWIPWYREKPLVFFTPKGVCRVWDKDWKVHGVWDGTSNEIVFLSGQSNGVGGDIRVDIAASGDIAMTRQP